MRRRSILLVMLTATLALTLGADSKEGCSRPAPAERADAPPAPDPCKNAEALVAVCSPDVSTATASPCKGLEAQLTKATGDAAASKEVVEGCVTGCMMQLCPSLDRCDAMPDPSWCGTSCADLTGGVFWHLLLDAAEDCTAIGYSTQPGLGACVETAMEGQCWSLQGTDWADKLPGLTK